MYQTPTKRRNLGETFDALNGPIHYPPSSAAQWLNSNHTSNNGFNNMNTTNNVAYINNGQINIYYEKCCGRCRHCNEFCKCNDCYDFVAITCWILVFILGYIGISYLFSLNNIGYGSNYSNCDRFYYDNVEIANEVTLQERIKAESDKEWIGFGDRTGDRIIDFVKMCMSPNAWYFYSFILIFEGIAAMVICRCINCQHHDYYN